MARKAFRDYQVFDFLSKKNQYSPDAVRRAVKAAVAARTKEDYESI